ncbi:hypothetical protein ACFPC0_10665 [Streptomyces andamanensis]|uniref:Winged helix DNA-binding domain-containing protein n=1 Tax=Streptomyces andamanensis TaxID=1565035 RepID=A0ABV8TCE7_9ACTN
MKLSKAQAETHAALLRAPGGAVTSGGGIQRRTIDALERMGLVEVTRQVWLKTRHHRDGTTSQREQVDWTARLTPRLPSPEQLEELDLIIANREGILRPGQRRQAAAYIAHMMPLTALKGSPARKPGYRPADGYAEAMKWPVSKLLDTVMMLRHMTGQTDMPAQPVKPTGEMTDVWAITAKNDDGSAGKELGRVRGDSQVIAALAANGLLNVRGGYLMRRLGTLELDGWISDFRASGMVLRLAECADGTGFQVSLVSTGEILTVRTTPDEARRDALTDLTTLFATLADSPEPELIRAD